jgi:hypothetical protein
MQQEKNDRPDPELSATWLELLGATLPGVQPKENAEETGIPVLESDPWRALLQGKDIALVDLQKISLHAYDQDVERALQMMQEREQEGQ